MRNSVNITRGYQFGYMLIQHIKAALVCVIFQAVAFYSFLTGDISRYIIAGIFTVVYGMMLYSSSKKLSDFDNKPYTPLNPDTRFGILWGVVIALTVALFIVIHRLNWVYNTSTVLTVIVNIIAYLWLGPYFGFFSENGTLPVWAVIVMIFIPIAATALGYIAGNKKFDMLAKLDSMTFEKDEDEE